MPFKKCSKCGKWLPKKSFTRQLLKVTTDHALNALVPGKWSKVCNNCKPIRRG